MMSRRVAAVALLALCVTGALAKDRKDRDDREEREDGPKKPVADLLFVLSADMATFSTANTLVLSNATSTAQFYGKGAHAGVIPTATFANDTAGAKYVSANGQWLSNPTATLYGYDQNGTDHSILLMLSSPMADAANKTVTFNATVINNGTSIKTRKGVANNALMESVTEKDMLLNSVQAGTMMSDVALFIDSDSSALGTKAQTKSWWRGGWGGGYNRGYYNNGWGGGYGGGYRRWGWGK